jgi:hypothetical protein
MEELPVDARSVVDELRSASRQLSGAQPRTWVPSQSFASLLEDTDAQPVALSEHLAWLHQNASLEHALAPPPGGGAKGWAKRSVHRVVVAALRPYLTHVQECIAVMLRSVDTVARRVDQQAATQLRTIGAVRADLVDFAQHVDERLDDRPPE